MAPASTDITSNLVSPVPVSAAETVFNIVEIRNQIIRLLPLSNLANFLRVSHDSMAEVIKLLYHNIGYKIAYSRMSKSKVRQEMYRSAVRLINARNLIMGNAFVEFVEQHASSSEMANLERYDGRYVRPTFPLLVTPLRKTYRGLQKILFGGEYKRAGDEFWEVICTPAGPGQNLDGGGNVLVVHPVAIPLHLRAMIGMHTSPPPSPEYTIDSRFDVQLRTEPHKGQNPEWPTALKEGKSWLDHTYRSINFGPLALSLEDIIRIYQQKIAKGHKPLIEHITGHFILPFTIPEFRAFARVAAASLITLDLGVEYSADRTSISFSDLPELISIIRDDLPNLTGLRIAINDIDTADKVRLPAEFPQSGGTLKSLHIVTAPHSHHLLNLIRCLSPLCASSCKLEITHVDQARWGPAAQTKFLRLVQSQVASQAKSVVSAIDLSSLRISR